jgi:hypothetical protein
MWSPRFCVAFGISPSACLCTCTPSSEVEQGKRWKACAWPALAYTVSTYAFWRAHSVALSPHVTPSSIPASPGVAQERARERRGARPTCCSICLPAVDAKTHSQSFPWHSSNRSRAFTQHRFEKHRREREKKWPQIENLKEFYKYIVGCRHD